MDVKGFPMALHLWFLASVPKLQDAFAQLDNKDSDWPICARDVSTQQPTYAQIWCKEESKDAKVTCVLSSFNDAADLSTLLDEEEDDDLGKITNLVSRGYNLTEFDWKRNFIELEKAEEFISQMHQEDQFQGQEVEFDVGDYVSPRLEAPTHHLSALVRPLGVDREVRFDETLDKKETQGNIIGSLYF